MKIKRQSLPIIASALLAIPAFAQPTPDPQAPAQPPASKFTWNFNGWFDAGYTKITAGDHALSKTFMRNSNVETTRLIGQLNYDLGDRFQAIALEEIDQDITNSSKANQGTPGNVFTGTPFQGQQYVGLRGPWGDLKFGVPNSWGLTAGAISTPFGTGSGSGYTGIIPFTRLGTTAASGITGYEGNGVGRVIRHERTGVFESATYRGFSGALEYAPSNGNASDGNANNNNGWLGISGSFRNSRTQVTVFHGESRAPDDVRASGTTPPSSTTQVPSGLAAGQKIKFDMIGANFKIVPTVTVYGGYTKTKATNDIENDHSWNVAGKYTIRNLDLMANYLVRSANVGVNAPAANKVPEGRLFGLGADYWLSADRKAAFFWRYEDINHIDALGRSYKTNMIGMRFGFDIGKVPTPNFYFSAD